ncbi:MAG: TIGR03435 family protein [Bacteroidota bacterium]
MRSTLVAASAFLLCFSVHAQTFNVGASAPDVTITRYISAPSSATTDLNGRWAVVEFWASWCSFCVGNIPNTDRLAADLAQDSVPVITLSQDPPAVLRELFSTRPTRSWVAFDSTGATADRFQIGGYPQAVVIDPEGRIAAFTDPRNLSADVVRALVRGEQPEIPYEHYRFEGTRADFEWDQTTTLDEDDPDLYTQTVIRRSSSSETFLRWRPTPGRILGDGVRLPALIQHAYGVSEYTFDNQLPASNAVFQVSVVASTRTHDAARAMLRDALTHAFNLSARTEERELDVVVLRRRPGAAFSERFGPTDPDRAPLRDMGGPAGVFVNEVDLGFLVSILEDYVFNTLVIDETGLDGTFDIDIGWQRGDEASAERALREAGFEILREQRLVPVLMVENSTD